jgi:hypothetical protein
VPAAATIAVLLTWLSAIQMSLLGLPVQPFWPLNASAFAKQFMAAWTCTCSGLLATKILQHCQQNWFVCAACPHHIPVRSNCHCMEQG